MRWHTASSALVGVLLTLPLVIALGIAMYGERRAHGFEEVKVSPVLSFEERLQLPTYDRRCEKSEECDPLLGCLKHWMLTESYCTDSECVTDEQCSEGYSCQTLRTEGIGPLVRSCLLLGVRKEGEECEAFPSKKAQACGPDLKCSAGRCGRTCRPDEPGSCPDGFFCGGTEGMVCLPTCEERGCPEGQQCVRFNRVGARRVSTCAVVYGTNCQDTPCAEGQTCWNLSVHHRPGEAWMKCAQRCGPSSPPCPEGLTCGTLQCIAPCDPQNPEACPQGFKCSRKEDTQPWACRPDW